MVADVALEDAVRVEGSEEVQERADIPGTVGGEDAAVTDVWKCEGCEV